MKKTTGIKSNIHDEPIRGHRYGKKLTNDDYGTVAFLINKGDILENKKANANSFIDPELKFNCIYFLIGHEYDNDGNTIEKMYVGQAGIRDNQQSVLDRLNEHAWLGNDPAKYIDKWQDIVVVTNEKGAWGATELDALEHIFWSLIPVGNRLNSQKPTCTGADLESFTNAVNQIKEYLDYLEFTTFKERTSENIIADVKEVADSKSDVPIDLDHGTTSIPNITTPIKVINQMLDLLPEEVWNDQTVFLDPACKDGGYLKAIHDRLVKRPELIQKYGSERALSIHILSEQLYGIALNQNSRAVTIDKLDGFRYNIRVIPNYINILKYISNLIRKENKIDANTLIQRVINKEFNKEMKFDVVIGNPPYQEATQSIYQYFIELGLNLSDKVCMITKDNWMTSDTLKETRVKMIQAGIGKIIHYPEVGEVFSNVTPCVTIFTINGSKETFYTMIRNNIITNQYNAKLKESQIIFESELDQEIYNQVYDFLNDGNYGKYIQPSECFRITPNGEIGRTKVLIDDADEASSEYNTALIYMGSDKEPYRKYMKYEDIPAKSELAHQFKVVCGRIISKDNQVIRNINVTDNNCVLTSSYAVIYNDNDKQNAVHAMRYIKTKFFRFLVRLLTDKGTIVTSEYRFSLVPLQDFSSNSDIDWLQPINDIDKQLYQKYGLSEKEIEYIEKTIKSMDDTPSKPKVKLTNEDIQANYINKMINKIRT